MAPGARAVLAPCRSKFRAQFLGLARGLRARMGALEPPAQGRGNNHPKGQRVEKPGGGEGSCLDDRGLERGTLRVDLNQSSHQLRSKPMTQDEAGGPEDATCEKAKDAPGPGELARSSKRCLCGSEQQPAQRR